MLKDGSYSSQTTRRNMWVLFGAAMMLLSAVAIFYLEIVGFAAFLALIAAPIYLVITYRVPALNIYFLLFYSFFLFAFSRYVLRGLFPAGVFFDGMIVLGYLTVWAAKKFEWKKFLEAPVFILGIWLIYCVFSITLPDAPGMNSWLIAVRVHLYMVFTIPLLCLMLDVKMLKTLIVMWGVFSLIFTVKGFTQLHIFLDFADRAFLDGNHLHMLWGNLRVFSFCSDAGQFGVQQAHAAATGVILSLNAKNGKQRLFFLLIAVTGIYGMFVSGTRGAMFVLFGAAFAYCGLVKKTKLLILAAIFGGGFYFFMSHTYIGNNVYAIHRMRTALNPEQDASFLVRKMNQEKLKLYLANRPFGGGLGSMQHGVEGTVLADTPHDSGYVLVWGDQGIVGLCLYIGMFLLFMLKGTITVWFKIKNEWLRGVLIAMISSISGVAVANYGNEVMMQHPTSLMYFLTIALIYAAPRIDKSLQENVVEQPAPVSKHVTKYRGGR